jgi:hypothetical protein
MDAELKQQPRAGLRAIPRGIWALGFVSLFMGISSEMIHGLLPVFLTSVLGASAQMVGLIEGVGEATAAIGKLCSGWLSDKIGKRKMLTVIGYGLAALSKPLFALAPTPALVLATRFSDRVGKGVHDAPRDAENPCFLDAFAHLFAYITPSRRTHRRGGVPLSEVLDFRDRPVWERVRHNIHELEAEVFDMVESNIIKACREGDGAKRRRHAASRHRAPDVRSPSAAHKTPLKASVP